jgi:hypothetical protein
VSLRVNSIGEPDAANLHVRFDERGAETEAMVWTETPAPGESGRTQNIPRPNATAPLLDSTAAATRVNDSDGEFGSPLTSYLPLHCISAQPYYLWEMLRTRGGGIGDSSPFRWYESYADSDN